MDEEIEEIPLVYQINDFLYNLKIERNYSENTIESYRNDLMQYATFLNKYEYVNDVSDILDFHIERFIRSLKKKNLSKTSISRKISAIKSFHKYFYIDEHVTDVNPSSQITKPKRSLHLPDYLTIEEIDKMLDSIDTSSVIGLRNKALMEILYASGMRVSELCDLEINDVHLNEKYIRVIGKGNKERIVPIGDNAVYWVRKYITDSRDKIPHKPGGTLFINYKGDKISRQSIWKIVKKIASDVGIEKEIKVHTIRHSVATHLLQNGVDLRFIQEFLGHEDISTTQIYTHIGIEELKEKIQSLHQRRKKF